MTCSSPAHRASTDAHFGRGLSRAPALAGVRDRPSGLPATAFADAVPLWQEICWPIRNEPTSTRYAEGVINKIKVIKRRTQR
jgi:hypothetical protein